MSRKYDRAENMIDHHNHQWKEDEIQTLYESIDMGKKYSFATERVTQNE